MNELRLVTGNYPYQLEVTNSNGTTRDVKNDDGSTLVSAQRTVWLP